jgi:hypothetical protein
MILFARLNHILIRELTVLSGCFYYFSASSQWQVVVVYFIRGSYSALLQSWSLILFHVLRKWLMLVRHPNGKLWLCINMRQLVSTATELKPPLVPMHIQGQSRIDNLTLNVTLSFLSTLMLYHSVGYQIN